MICPWHHTRAHDQRYNMTRLPTGNYGFHQTNVSRPSARHQ